jgi:2-dehydro-3-deoxygluconokinase
MVSALPANGLGRACADQLRRHGVSTLAIHFGDGRMGMYFMTQGAGQRPSDVLYDRSHSTFADAPDDLFDWTALLADASWLHVSGITPGVSASAANAALLATTTARKMGVKVSFDCSFRARLWASRAAEAPRILRQLCEQADLIFGADRDIAFILGFDVKAVPAAQLQREAASCAFKAFSNLQWIASTLRTRHDVDRQDLSGLLFDAQTQWSTRNWPLAGIIDRIGAGDAFAAGILHGLTTQMDPQLTVNFATAAACLKHSIPGDFNLVGVDDIELALSELDTDVRR